MYAFLYRADQVLAISDFEQSPSDGFDELGADFWFLLPRRSKRYLVSMERPYLAN